MGLFDDVVGAFLKGDAGKYQAILSWVEEQGGIQVLLEHSGAVGKTAKWRLRGHSLNLAE